MKLLENLLARRPRILNQLHKLRLVEALTQTNEEELAALERHAKGKSIAVEVGSLQGVSAARVAAALAAEGILFCVDPWPPVNGKMNPNLQIFERHLLRRGMRKRIRLIHDFSYRAAAQIPERLEFAFIDGDHSWSGIEEDWNLLAPRIVAGGIVCLHDTAIPPSEPHRRPDSCRFYDDVIASNHEFRLLETVHSMRVLEHWPLRAAK